LTITILIPAFNEEKTIGEVITRVKRICKAEIIVIDDASTDNTAKIAKENGAIVARNQSRMGPSVAVRRGIKEAHGTLIVTIDADLDHLPEDIPKLLVLAEKGFDIVIGKRSKLPRMSERVLSLFTNRLISIKDPLSGFRVYNSRIFSKVDFGKIETYGMVLLAKSFIRGFQISEVPINTNVKKRESRIGYSYRVDFRIFISGFLFICCLIFYLLCSNPANQIKLHN
jgi:polyprenyl-phospho-N-acetylgalactosaminyl synthase